MEQFTPAQQRELHDFRRVSDVLVFFDVLRVHLDKPTARRVLFVRWLVRTGRLHEGEHWMTLDPRTARLSRYLESCS